MSTVAITPGNYVSAGRRRERGRHRREKPDCWRPHLHGMHQHEVVDHETLRPEWHVQWRDPFYEETHPNLTKPSYQHLNPRPPFSSSPARIPKERASKVQAGVGFGVSGVFLCMDILCELLPKAVNFIYSLGFCYGLDGFGLI